MSNTSCKSFFVAGTDTDVGKTVISAGILQGLNRRGLSTAGYKPVSAGCEKTPAGLRNEDAMTLLENSSIELAYQEVNPVAFEDPVAPHLAAHRLGQSINFHTVTSGLDNLVSKQPDVLLVEGAGGWRLPLDQDAYLSNLPMLYGMPVILVVGMRLGCLNHALLTYEAIQRDGLHDAGWVANEIDPQMLYKEDNLAALTHLLQAPLLGHVPFLAEGQSAADYLHLDILLDA